MQTDPEKKDNASHTDELILSLTGDLKARKCHRMRYMLFAVLAFLGVFATGYLLMAGTRPDITNMMNNEMALWKAGIFLFGFAIVAILTSVSAFPGRKAPGYFTWLLVACITLYLLPVIWDVLQKDTQVLMQDVMAANGRHCMLSVLAVGAVLMCAIIFLMSRFAPTHPALSGALAGLTGGLGAAFAYALHCAHDQPAYVLLWYSLPLVVLAGAGALIGWRFLRW